MMPKYSFTVEIELDEELEPASKAQSVCVGIEEVLNTHLGIELGAPNIMGHIICLQPKKVK
jgi:hypothetical protein